VREAFERYETALVRNDVAALMDFFLSRPDTVRFGIAEHCFGIEAIARYRKTAPPVHQQRKLMNTVITSFGLNAASACTEFIAPDSKLIGRQTQTWIRIDGKWFIVAAHVSLIDPDTLKRF
jgi:hypothetical protein